MLTPKRTRQLYVWHKWTGLITGLFIFFVSVTGSAVVFKHEIEAWLNPGMLITPQEKRLPLESVVAELKKAYPKNTVNAMQIAQWPNHTHTVSFRIDGKMQKLFVDPYTGKVSGMRVNKDVVNVLRQTHLRFYFFGWKGRVFVGFIGLCMVLASVTGLLIYGPFMKKLAFGQIRWGQKLQLILSDWHKLIGILTIVFNLVVGLTGAVLGLENLQRFSPAAKQILHPSPTREMKAIKPKTVTNRMTIDEAVAKAQEAMPNFSPASINLPRANNRHWMLRGRIDGHLSAANTAWIILDTQTGKTIGKYNPAEHMNLTTAYNVSEPLHFGDFAGLPMKLLYCLLGVVSGLLYITGFWIWILKTWQAKRKAKITPATT